MVTAPVSPTPWDLHSRRHDGVLVRKAGPDDVVELAALKRGVERRCHAHLGSPEALSVRLHRRCTAWYLLTRLAAGDLLLAGELHGRLVGLGAARVERGPCEPVVHLHSTYVDQPGRGVGRSLTAARLEAASRLGLRTVTADALVGADAAAARLRALGLTEQGDRTDSPTFPGVQLSHWAGSVHTALERVTA